MVADGERWATGPPGDDAQQPDDAARDEAETVRRARQDPRLFAPVYQRYHDEVFAYCWRRLGDRERARDITSQVFTRALGGLGGFHGGSVAAWLFTITRHAVIDAHRTYRPHTSLDAVPVLVDPAPSPLDHVLRDDRCRQLRAAMARLTPDQREIVALRWAGLTGPEIAETLGLSLSAVKSGQYRAYARLRTLLADDREGDLS